MTNFWIVMTFCWHVLIDESYLTIFNHLCDIWIFLVLLCVKPGCVFLSLLLKKNKLKYWAARLEKLRVTRIFLCELREVIMWDLFCFLNFVCNIIWLCENTKLPQPLPYLVIKKKTHLDITSSCRKIITCIFHLSKWTFFKLHVPLKHCNIHLQWWMFEKKEFYWM